MPLATTSSPIACRAAALSAVDADLIIVPWFEDESSSAVPHLDAAIGGEMSRALASKEFAAKPFDLFITPVMDRNWRAHRVALVGAGKSSDYGGEAARKLAAASGLAMRARRLERVAFALRGRGDVVELAPAVGAGVTLS